MIAHLSFLGSKHKKDFFQIWKIDKMTLEVDLFSSIGCILSISHILSIGYLLSIDLRVVVF